MAKKKVATKRHILNGMLFPEMAANGASRKRNSTYDPLPSIWEGTDAELLERMLDFYPQKKPQRIL